MQDQNAITLIAQFTAASGKENALEQVLRALVAPTLQEAGCSNYVLHKSSSNVAIFMFYEVWKNQNAFDSHLDSIHFKEAKSKFDPLLLKPIDVTFWELF